MADWTVRVRDERLPHSLLNTPRARLSREISSHLHMSHPMIFSSSALTLHLFISHRHLLSYCVALALFYFYFYFKIILSSF